MRGEALGYHFYFLSFITTLLAGCQPTTEPAGAGYDYFPLETGRYVIYDVQWQQYAPNAAPVEQIYQLKEVVGAAYTDVAGQTAWRLLRYRRPDDGQPWQPDSVWSARLINNEAIRTENGRDFVKLVFPLADGLRWNGNRHNPADAEEYLTRNNGEPYRVLDKPFYETVTVVARNDSTLLSQDKRIEVYARQVGMIFKEITQLQFCASSPGCVGTNQIDYGIRQLYHIRASGRE